MLARQLISSVGKHANCVCCCWSWVNVVVLVLVYGHLHGIYKYCCFHYWSISLTTKCYFFFWAFKRYFRILTSWSVWPSCWRGQTGWWERCRRIDPTWNHRWSHMFTAFLTNVRPTDVHWHSSNQIVTHPHSFLRQYLLSITCWFSLIMNDWMVVFFPVGHE